MNLGIPPKGSSTPHTPSPGTGGGLTLYFKMKIKPSSVSNHVAPTIMLARSIQQELELRSGPVAAETLEGGCGVWQSQKLTQ